MGWNPFKSEEVTRVATSVTRVIDDAAVPNSINKGLIKSVLQDSGVTDTILDELTQGVGVRAERMYRNAKANYPYGLPSGQVYSSTQGRLQVEQVIEQQIENQQVSIEYSHYGPLNALHIGWTKLLADHGYDPVTNALGGLSAQKGKPVYLKDMVVVVPASQLASTEHGRLVQWGTPACSGYTPERAVTGWASATAVHTDTVATDVYLEVTGVWATGIVNTPYAEATFTIDLSGYDLTANYFQAKYQVGSQTKYWLYKIGSGTYPLLDAAFVEGPAVNGSYFPFTYFRYNKQATNSDPTSVAYKKTKAMLKILGMNFDTVADAIGANPDIGNIEQAILFFGVPSVSTNLEECRYLFDYFDAQRAAMDETTTHNEAGILSAWMQSGAFGNWADTAHTTVIRDARFKMALGNNGIYKRIVAGSIGKIGTYTSVFESNTSYQETLGFEGNTEMFPVTTKVHRYRHQITDGLYEEILVAGLRMTYYVYGNYTTGGDDVSDLLMVPIDQSISATYSIKDREVLYSRSMHIIFNARVVQEVKWYQQEWFQIVMIVVAIVLTIIDLGSDGGSWIAGVLKLTGDAAIVATVVFNLVVGMYIMPKVFSLFVKAFGQKAAEILSIALIIYGAYSLTTSGMQGLPTAADMLMLSTGLEKAVIQAKFGDLIQDYSNLSEWEKTQQAELQRANDLLEKQTVLNPFVIFGEKPEDFYNRTIHTGNIGTLGINAVSSYVDVALTLPKIYDTLGEPING